MSAFYQPGTYRVQFSGQGFVKAASSGNMQLVLRFKVLECADGSTVSAQYDRSMYQTITDNTVERLVAGLAGIGYTGEKWSTLDPATPNYHSFDGVESELYCKHEADNQGGMRERWGFPMQAKAIDPMETSELRKLDALFGRQLKTATRGAGPKPVAARQPQPAAVMGGMEISDDDIPF